MLVKEHTEQHCCYFSIKWRRHRRASKMIAANRPHINTVLWSMPQSWIPSIPIARKINSLLDRMAANCNLASPATGAWLANAMCLKMGFSKCELGSFLLPENTTETHLFRRSDCMEEPMQSQPVHSVTTRDEYRLKSDVDQHIDRARSDMKLNRCFPLRPIGRWHWEEEEESLGYYTLKMPELMDQLHELFLLQAISHGPAIFRCKYF